MKGKIPHFSYGETVMLHCQTEKKLTDTTDITDITE